MIGWDEILIGSARGAAGIRGGGRSLAKPPQGIRRHSVEPLDTDLALPGVEIQGDPVAADSNLTEQELAQILGVRSDRGERGGQPEP